MVNCPKRAERMGIPLDVYLLPLVDLDKVMVTIKINMSVPFSIVLISAFEKIKKKMRLSSN